MIWIIALVLLVIAGNLLWLLPSKAERKRMKLRNQALKDGLTCREVRDSSLLPERAKPEEGPWLEYAIASATEEEFTTQSVEKSIDGQWSNSRGVETSRLQDLPESSVRVSLRQETIGVLWNERGETEDVDKIAEFLRYQASLRS